MDKSRFLANLSHEFRTPLTLILNTLNQETLEKINNSKELLLSAKEVDIMQRNASRLQQLINQLLDLSKLESGKMELHLTRGNFDYYLHQLVQSFEPLAKNKSLTLIYESDKKMNYLSFDRDKLDKIVYNLLSNAIKFTEASGQIIVRLFQEDNGIRLEVEDTGMGIASEDQEKIFDRFYQLSKEEDFSHEGTGIGLALVKELVEVYQGRIELESEVGKGSCFKIFLPMKNTDANIQASTTPIEDQTTILKEGERSSQPLLLVIEDNEDLLFHHQKTFAKEYELLLAKDGNTGLEMALKYIPDIILCDVMLPGKNGYEICKVLKTDERTNHIPILLLSAKAAQEEKLNGLSVGADEYMTKPYHQQELSLRLHNLLSHRQSIQQQFQAKSLSKEESIPMPSPHEQFVQKCYDIIEQKINDRNFGVEELSNELAMSRTHLFRKLKSITGYTPTQFIRRYRLEKAKKLLNQFAGNGSEVAYKVGFNSPNYFFKCFKEAYGITVGEYMNTLQVDA